MTALYVAIVIAQQPIGSANAGLPYSPSPLMTFDFNMAVKTTTTDEIWECSGTIGDFDTYREENQVGVYTYRTDADETTRWDSVLRSGPLYNNGFLNPQFSHLGPESNKTKLTIKTKEVNATSVVQDTHIPEDVNEIKEFYDSQWHSNKDTNGSVQVVTVTINPKPNP